MLRISVVIPVYNVEKYVAQCLDSVLNQRFEAYEIICVDDASTDESGDIIKKYAEKSNKIRIVTHICNLGLSAARNTGVKNARGKYILFVDSDDMILPNALGELYEMAERNNTDIVYFNYKKIYESEMETLKESVENLHNEYAGVYSGQELFAKYVQNKDLKIEVWRQFFRRSFLLEEKIKSYEGILHEDILFSFLCAMKAKRVININKEYYLYRQRKGSIMATMNKMRMESMYIICLEIFEYWKTHNFCDEINRAISTFFDYQYRAFYYQKNLFFEEVELSIGGYAERHLFALLSRPVKGYAALSDDKIENLKKAPQVIVFGAGRAAMDIIQICNRKNVAIVAVGVSNVDSNAKSVCGLRVQSMEELVKYKDTAHVIVSVTKRFREGAKEYLEKLGFRTLIAVDDC